MTSHHPKESNRHRKWILPLVLCVGAIGFSSLVHRSRSLDATLVQKANAQKTNAQKTNEDVQAASESPFAPKSTDRTQTTTPNDATQHYNRGLALQSDGNVASAIDAYRQALRINETLAEAHNNLAAALAVSDQLEQATNHFRRVVELRPEYANGFVNLGNVLAAQNQLEQAIVNYRRAIELKPNYVKAYNNLAVALKRTGRLKEAYHYMQEAMRLKRAEAKP